jgi:Flp pilus assembly protein TadG
VAAIEFGLLAPVLMVLLFGLVDVGALTYQEMEVVAAAHAGAAYVIQNGYSAGGVSTAVTGATGMTITATPAPSTQSACANTGALVVTANATCSDGSKPGTYVVITAQATFTPIITWTSFGLPSSLTAQTMVRIS